MNFCNTIPTHLRVAKLFKDMLSFYEVLFSLFTCGSLDLNLTPVQKWIVFSVPAEEGFPRKIL